MPTTTGRAGLGARQTARGSRRRPVPTARSAPPRSPEPDRTRRPQAPGVLRTRRRTCGARGAEATGARARGRTSPRAVTGTTSPGRPAYYGAFVSRDPDGLPRNAGGGLDPRTGQCRHHVRRPPVGLPGSASRCRHAGVPPLRSSTGSWCSRSLVQRRDGPPRRRPGDGLDPVKPTRATSTMHSTSSGTTWSSMFAYGLIWPAGRLPVSGSVARFDRPGSRRASPGRGGPLLRASASVPRASSSAGRVRSGTCWDQRLDEVRRRRPVGDQSTGGGSPSASTGVLGAVLGDRAPDPGRRAPSPASRSAARSLARTPAVIIDFLARGDHQAMALPCPDAGLTNAAPASSGSASPRRRTCASRPWRRADARRSAPRFGR